MSLIAQNVSMALMTCKMALSPHGRRKDIPVRVKIITGSLAALVENLFTPNSGKEKTCKHKQICGIVPGLGGCQDFVYVFFWGHSLWGRKNT